MTANLFNKLALVAALHLEMLCWFGSSLEVRRCAAVFGLARAGANPRDQEMMERNNAPATVVVAGAYTPFDRCEESVLLLRCFRRQFDLSAGDLNL
jgi:hypothetical protein